MESVELTNSISKSANLVFSEELVRGGHNSIATPRLATFSNEVLGRMDAEKTALYLLEPRESTIGYIIDQRQTKG
jgi:hypothetical protein